MALADLRALARVGEAGTRGTRGEIATRSRADAEESPEICPFPSVGTRGTPGTREIDEAGRGAEARHPLPPGIAAHPETLADRAAIAADTWPGGPPVHPEPPPDLVDRLAAAEARLPWQRATGPEGLDYLRDNARTRLARLDPLARGLLVAAAEATARALVVHGRTRFAGNSEKNSR